MAEIIFTGFPANPSNGQSVLVAANLTGLSNYIDENGRSLADAHRGDVATYRSFDRNWIRRLQLADIGEIDSTAGTFIHEAAVARNPLDRSLSIPVDKDGLTVPTRVTIDQILDLAEEYANSLFSGQGGSERVTANVSVSGVKGSQTASGRVKREEVLSEVIVPSGYNLRTSSYVIPEGFAEINWTPDNSDDAYELVLEGLSISEINPVTFAYGQANSRRIRLVALDKDRPTVITSRRFTAKEIFNLSPHTLQTGNISNFDDVTADILDIFDATSIFYDLGGGESNNGPFSLYSSGNGPTRILSRSGSSTLSSYGFDPDQHDNDKTFNGVIKTSNGKLGIIIRGRFFGSSEGSAVYRVRLIRYRVSLTSPPQTINSSGTVTFDVPSGRPGPPGPGPDLSNMQFRFNGENVQFRLSDVDSWKTVGMFPRDPGSDVIANPSGDDGEDLTRVTIDGKNYNISGDSEGLTPEQKEEIKTNSVRSQANATRLNALDGIVGSIRYAANFRVNPSSIDAHTDVQRKFTATLSNLDEGLLFSQALFDRGDPLSGSRVDNIRVIASDGIVVHGGPPLINGAANPKFVRWQFGDTTGPLSISWEIDSQEAAELGLNSGDDWVRFRLIFYRENNEVARTNEYIVKIGEDGLYPPTKDELDTAIKDASGTVSYGNGTPLQISDTGDSGDRSVAAREDHVHPLELVSGELAFNSSKELGIAQAFKNSITGATYDLAKQIGDLNIDLTPDVVQDTSNPTRPGDVLDLRFQIDPGTNPFDSSNYPYYQIVLSGQQIGNRTRWTGSRISFTISASIRDALVQNLSSTNRSIDGEMRFFTAASGGSSVGAATFHITVLPPIEIPTPVVTGPKSVYKGGEVQLEGASWVAVDIDNAVNSNKQYQIITRGAQTSPRTTLTRPYGQSAPFWGSVLIDAGVNGGGAISSNGEPNFMAVPYVRTAGGGSLTMWIAIGNAAAQSAAAAGKTRIFVHVQVGTADSVVDVIEF